jgi:hypothetical protein
LAVLRLAVLRLTVGLLAMTRLAVRWLASLSWSWTVRLLAARSGGTTRR